MIIKKCNHLSDYEVQNLHVTEGCSKLFSSTITPRVMGCGFHLLSPWILLKATKEHFAVVLFVCFLVYSMKKLDEFLVLKSL